MCKPAQELLEELFHQQAGPRLTRLQYRIQNPKCRAWKFQPHVQTPNPGYDFIAAA